MHVDDLDISPSKIGETAQRIVDRAFEEARRREHALLTNEHIFLAFAQVEWDMFSEVMRDIELNPHTVLQAVEEHLHMVPAFAGRDLRASPATKLVFKLALHHASRAGRQTIEAADLFSAVFEETQGVPVSILRRHGVEPDVLVSRLHARMRDMELREERLKKRFELPPFLKHFATNMNMLARQDKLPPVFGRDKEIQQVLEILCHRERANSVMLIGEPGVGKTAIAEGLARRIEFEPDTVPVRLRDCQVVNLQMNTMVAGTMLRGHVRGPHPECHSRAEGASESDPLRGRSAHDGGSRVGAGRPLGRRQRVQVRPGARRNPHGRRHHAERVQGIHPGGRSAGASIPVRDGLRADHRGNAADSLQLAAASRAELFSAPVGRIDRDRPRDGAALHAPPAPSRQSHRLARYRRRPGRNRSSMGGERAGRGVGHFARGADSRRTWSPAT